MPRQPGDRWRADERAHDDEDHSVDRRQLLEGRRRQLHARTCDGIFTCSCWCKDGIGGQFADRIQVLPEGRRRQLRLQALFASWQMN